MIDSIQVAPRPVNGDGDGCRTEEYRTSQLAKQELNGKRQADGAEYAVALIVVFARAVNSWCCGGHALAYPVDDLGDDFDGLVYFFIGGQATKGKA
jgi:hypothetical protein